MRIPIPGGWNLFCIAAAIALFAVFVMQLLGRRFITKDVLVRSFNILDLELAATEREIDNTLRGIPDLGPYNARKVIAALRAHLYVNFAFMPAAYGAIFIACMQVAWKMTHAGAVFFSLLAWLQVGAWACDIVENLYLLRKIKRAASKPPSPDAFYVYQRVEAGKWALSLLALVCVLSALMYFWVSGKYNAGSLRYLLIIAGEVILFVLLIKSFKNTNKDLESLA